MKTLIGVFAVVVAFSSSVKAQITAVGPFTADGFEGFDSQLAQSGVACILPRVFANRGDMCALPTGTVATAPMFSSLSWGISSRSGVRCASTGVQGAAIIFDTPVARFGGYFGLATGNALFYDANGTLLGTEFVEPGACAAPTTCQWKWNGWEASAGTAFARIELVPVGSYGIVVDDLVASFGLAPNSLTYCNGDGAGTACPCGNNSGGAPRGCANSTQSGARSTVSGSASLVADTVVIAAEFMPSFASVLFFQGTQRVLGGSGLPFGDGLLCVGGTLARLGVKTSSLGAARYPTAGDPSVHLSGFISVPGTYSYQAWYRDADLGYCTAATFNLTNACEIVWQP